LCSELKWALLPGYSIEGRCRNVTYHSEREHRGFVLGKQARYFEAPDMAWPHMLKPIAESVEATDAEDGSQTAFQFVTTSGEAGTELPEPGVVSIGWRNQEGWFEALARSKLLVSLVLARKIPLGRC